MSVVRQKDRTLNTFAECLLNVRDRASALSSVVLVLDVDCVYFLVMMFVCFYSRPIL